MDKYKLVGSLVMVSALAYLAYALISVTSELQNIREDLPGLLQQVEIIEQNIDVPTWVKLVEKLETQLPELLSDIAATRQTVDGVNQNINPILQEVKAIREQTIPLLLSEVTAIRKDMIPPVWT